MLIASGLGLLVGILLALTGAGGGILAVPLLVYGIQMKVADTAPIGLLAVGMAAALGAVLGLRDGIVRYRAALLIAGVGMLASPSGVWLAQRIDNRWLGILFALVLLLVAMRTFSQALRKKDALPVSAPAALPCRRDPTNGRFRWTVPCVRALALSGAGTGLLSGLLGVGGGFVSIPALQRYTDLPMRSAVATSLAVIALVAVAGVATSAATGGLTWRVALPFTGGALAGMLAGRLLSARLSGPRLQAGFAVVAAAIAMAMLYRYVA